MSLLEIAMKLLILCSLILLSSIASAEPYQSADAKAGQMLAEKNCVSCHAESFGGDGSEIYTRESRKVKSSKGLVSQVRNCNTMLGLKWFEDEEQNVARYLNQTYYKFTE
jgi:hypothetical protein